MDPSGRLSNPLGPLLMRCSHCVEPCHWNTVRKGSDFRGGHRGDSGPRWRRGMRRRRGHLLNLLPITCLPAPVCPSPSPSPSSFHSQGCGAIGTDEGTVGGREIVPPMPFEEGAFLKSSLDGNRPAETVLGGGEERPHLAPSSSSSSSW